MASEAKTDKKDNPVDVELKKRDASWPLVLWYIHVYILGSYGIYVTFTSALWSTILFSELNKSGARLLHFQFGNFTRVAVHLFQLPRSPYWAFWA